MDEAATLFLQQGYDATSLRDIAEAVGMKAGSIYYHFASKDELLAQILHRGITVMQTAFDDAERVTGTRPTARIEAHVRAHLAALFENGPYTAAHVMTFRTAPDAVRDEIVPVRDAYEARWTDLLSDLQAAGKIPPELKGKLDGFAMRVPVCDGSVVDLAVRVTRDVTIDEVNAAMKAAASKAPLQGVLEYCEDPIVSVDVIGNPPSSVFDAPSTMVMAGKTVKVVSWYDNEWGYSNRLVDLMVYANGLG